MGRQIANILGTAELQPFLLSSVLSEDAASFELHAASENTIVSASRSVTILFFIFIKLLLIYLIRIYAGSFSGFFALTAKSGANAYTLCSSGVCAVEDHNLYYFGSLTPKNAKSLNVA